MHLPNGKTLEVELRGKGGTYDHATLNGEMLDGARITHDQLMQGGKLVFQRKKDKGMIFFPPVPIRCGRVVDTLQPFFNGEISYTLNKQFRTWPLSMGWDDDTLIVRCKEASYCISRKLVDHAEGFCWDSPQRDDAGYVANGTFAFISRKALSTLLQDGMFIYDGITWREVSRTDSTITVRADIDRTEMTISLTHPLPLVLNMRRNPLGIDWNIILHE